MEKEVSYGSVPNNTSFSIDSALQIWQLELGSK
jgi:hypothetical protein